MLKIWDVVRSVIEDHLRPQLKLRHWDVIKYDADYRADEATVVIKLARLRLADPVEPSSVIKTGDHVRHKKSGETWVCAFVENGIFAWCGWPGGTAGLDEFELVKSAPPAESQKLLLEMAGMSEDDFRRRYARRELARQWGADT